MVRPGERDCLVRHNVARGHFKLLPFAAGGQDHGHTISATEVTVDGDIEDVAICDLTPVVLAHSISCSEKNALRAMDAIHIGSAISMGADVFVSADKRQLEAAATSGLSVESV
jgi:hypothetical protein